MTRLKGGKLLLDLSEYNLSDEPSINLSEEQINAILSKGLILKLKSPKSGLIFVYEPQIDTTVLFEDMKRSISFLPYNDVDSDGTTSYGFTLFIDDKTLDITI